MRTLNKQAGLNPRKVKTIFQIDGVLIAYCDNNGSPIETDELDRLFEILEQRSGYGSGHRRDWYSSQNGQVIMLQIRKARNHNTPR